MRSTLLAAALATCSVLAGCVFDPVDLRGKACPCAGGWTCDEERNECVPGLGARRDAGAPDGGSAVDAGTNDDLDAAAPRPADGNGPARVDAGLRRDAGDRDASTEDGGAGDDGAVPDAPPPIDVTACDDTLSGAIFCDGFEATSLSRWPTRTVREGAAARATDRAFRGVASLRADIAVATGRAHLEAPFTPVTSGDLHVRAYVYVPSSVAISKLHVLLVGENVAPWQGVAIGLSSGDAAALWIGPATREVIGAPGSIARDRWMCMTLHLSLHGSSGSAELSIDGREVTRASGMSTAPAGGYGVAVAGIEWASADQPSATVYLDEVAIGTMPLACD